MRTSPHESAELLHNLGLALAVALPATADWCTVTVASCTRILEPDFSAASDMQAHGAHDLHTVDWCGLRDYMVATGGHEV